MKFTQELHTPAALSSEITDIYANAPDTLLLGSLGRAVIFGRIYGNSQTEFKARAESPEMKIEYGEALARDIDVIGGQITQSDRLGPFEVDLKAFGSRQLSIKRQGADWFLVSESRAIYEPLHPAVMEPVTGESVYGAIASTVPLQTHLALFGLKGMRQKDLDNRALLALAEPLEPNPLPPELYEPFVRLRTLANSGWLHHTRRAYRAVVPRTIRHKVAPLTSAIKDRLI